MLYYASVILTVKLPIVRLWSHNLQSCSVSKIVQEVSMTFSFHIILS